MPRIFAERNLTRKEIKQRFHARHPLYARNEHLRRRYGITLIEWELFFDAQGRRCAVCRTANPGVRNWHTDHVGPLPCTSDKIRGILCYKCNHEVGQHTRADAIRLRRSMQYVESFL